MSVMSLSVTAATDTSTLTDGEKGLLIMQRADINGDLAYTTTDASILLRAAAGIIESKDDYDLDLDGAVTLADAQKMLKVAAGIDSIITDEYALYTFNELINSVKTIKPGFRKTSTAVCPSIKVTTTGAPVGKLNVTNMEYKNYVATLVDVMNSFPYNTMLDDEMKAELEVMKQSAVDVYKPQVETKTVAATSNSHYTYFPVNNLGWSSKLTFEDIKSVSYHLESGNFVFTVKLDDKTYTGDQYPTGTAGFSGRQQLPYGKIFNIPALDESDGSVVNSMAFKNGVVTLKADIATGEVVSVDYGYSYTSNITSAQAEDSDLVMRTNTTANITENYVMN